MSRRLASYLIPLLVLASTASAQQIPFSRDLVPTRTALSRIGLEKGWSAAIPIGFGTERVLAMNLSEDMIFVQTNMANLHAYNAETGAYLWGVNLGRQIATAQPVALNSNRAFVANNSTLYCLDRKTGSTVWTAKLEATATGAAAASEERAMVGLSSGKLIAFNVRDHTQDKPPGRSAGSRAWTWGTGKPITARPVPADKVVAFASQDGCVYTVQDNPPSILYRYRTDGPIIGSLGTFGTRMLIVPSSDTQVYGIDLFTGDNKWAIPTGSPVIQEPLVASDSVYILNSAGKLTAADPNTGEVRWNVETGGGRLLAVGATRIYMESENRDMIIVDRTSGKILVSARETRERAGVNLREFGITYTNAINDRMYFISPSGFLICIREAGAFNPLPLRPAADKKFGYLPPDGEPQVPATLPPDAPDADPTQKPGDAAPADNPKSE